MFISWVHQTLQSVCAAYSTQHENLSLRSKATIHQVTTMLATSKNVLFPGHNHLLTTSSDYWWPNTLLIAWAPESEGSSVPVVSRWLWLGNRTFLELASMVVTWWIVAFLRRALQVFTSRTHSRHKIAVQGAGLHQEDDSIIDKS